jgi:DNA (cytosine-5)-methyltransferase 1
MPIEYNVIDLFAGPGGLGEGFSSLKKHAGRFKIRMSVEMEPSAHQTLQLRAFVRQFPEPPPEYYDYIRGTIFREELFDRYARKAAVAVEETLGGPRELGDSDDDELIYSRLRSLKRKHGGPWVVIGGPPCQAYSLVGRARNRGVKGYQAEKDKRHFLYTEYLKVLQTMRPEVFVMENVKGILSSKVGDQRIFPRLLEDLRCPNKALGKRSTEQGRYRIYSLVTGQELGDEDTAGSDCIIRSEDYGVPQTRHRVILLGVREDIDTVPGVLEKALGQVNAGVVLADLPDIRSGLSRQRDSNEAWAAEVAAQAKVVARELRHHGVSDHAVSWAVKRAKRLKSRGGPYVPCNKQFKGPEDLRDWLVDSNIAGFVNHESKAHMASDLGRYLYCASFARERNGTSPRSSEFAETFVPDHKSWASGKFADRFKVQPRNAPSSTIVSHIAKDGHYYIHPDPGQCRSLTVREAARLQTFPDNYFFEGNRTQQYVQVGNAVPPFLATQIAWIVHGLLS